MITPDGFFRHFFHKGDIFVASGLLTWASIPFLTKREEFAPQGSNCFHFSVDSFKKEDKTN